MPVATDRDGRGGDDARTEAARSDLGASAAGNSNRNLFPHCGHFPFRPRKLSSGNFNFNPHCGQGI
jgi:hypothetical protein